MDRKLLIIGGKYQEPVPKVSGGSYVRVWDIKERAKDNKDSKDSKDNKDSKDSKDSKDN